jgi:DNA-binding NtrC family response regulator
MVSSPGTKLGEACKHNECENRVDGHRHAIGPERTPAPHHSASERLEGSETILVIEDDDGVRALVRRVLEKFGYRLLAAGSADETFDICRTHDGPIDLVLSDVLVPGSNGPEIVTRVKAHSPATRVLFMSGHSHHPLLDKAKLESAAHFILKPFLPKDLLQRVRQLLDADGNGRSSESAHSAAS